MDTGLWEACSEAETKCVSLVKVLRQRKDSDYVKGACVGNTVGVVKVVSTESLGVTNLCMSVLVR